MWAVRASGVLFIAVRGRRTAPRSRVGSQPQSTACGAWCQHATVYAAVTFGTESSDVAWTEELLFGSQAATGMHVWRQAGRQYSTRIALKAGLHWFYCNVARQP